VIQHGSQSTEFGDQTVGRQQNAADTSQSQGNWNAHASKARGADCAKGKRAGNSTWNTQGSGNAAHADVAQGNRTDQSQGANQADGLAQDGGRLTAS
jgi:hypothetical protein